jgi:hypothetical protein
MVARLRLCALPAFVALAYANGALADRADRETLISIRASFIHSPRRCFPAPLPRWTSRRTRARRARRLAARTASGTSGRRVLHAARPVHTSPHTVCHTARGTSGRLLALYTPPHKGSSTTVSRTDIRSIQYLDSSAHGFVQEVALNWLFPYPLVTPTHTPGVSLRTLHEVSLSPTRCTVPSLLPRSATRSSPGPASTCRSAGPLSPTRCTVPSLLPRGATRSSPGPASTCRSAGPLSPTRCTVPSLLPRGATRSSPGPASTCRSAGPARLGRRTPRGKAAPPPPRSRLQYTSMGISERF